QAGDFRPGGRLHEGHGDDRELPGALHEAEKTPKRDQRALRRATAIATQASTSGSQPPTAGDRWPARVRVRESALRAHRAMVTTKPSAMAAVRWPRRLRRRA